MPSTVHFISKQILEAYVPEYDTYEYASAEIGTKLTPYVKANLPTIRRGDALELDVCYGCPGRKEHFMFWDGEQVIPQCTDYYDYDGGGPPLCFKTFTEFPMEYFSEVAWFGNSVYLDYDTFADQIRNLQFQEDEDLDEDSELLIEYQGETYSLNLDEADGNMNLYEYVELIKEGGARHIMLVNAKNRIVDIHGNEVY